MSMSVADATEQKHKKIKRVDMILIISHLTLYLSKQC